MDLGKISLVSFDPPPGAFDFGKSDHPKDFKPLGYFMLVMIVAMAALSVAVHFSSPAQGQESKESTSQKGDSH